ncbi:unnamed protein product [Closterium sp. NIES-65]|nr:unnamed protein product [Closterium sp. NIES-65]
MTSRTFNSTWAADVISQEEIAALYREFFSQEEIAALYRRFCALDRNGKGYVSGDEFLSIPEFAINPLAHRLLGMLEGVNFKDFVKWLAAFSSRATAEDRTRLTFAVYDVDGDGKISKGDVLIHTATLPLLAPSFPFPLSPPPVVFAVYDWCLPLVFAVYDVDGDGKISKGDVLAMLRDLSGSFLSEEQRQVGCGRSGLWERWLWERWVVGEVGCGRGGLWERRVCERRVVGEAGCGRGGLWERWVVGEVGCGRGGLWERRVVGEAGCGRGGLWERRVVGEVGCGRGGLWERWVVGEVGCGRGGLWERWVVVEAGQAGLRVGEAGLRVGEAGLRVGYLKGTSSP